MLAAGDGNSCISVLLRAQKELVIKITIYGSPIGNTASVLGSMPSERNKNQHNTSLELIQCAAVPAIILDRIVFLAISNI